MEVDASVVEDALRIAARAAKLGGSTLLQVLDELPAPIYITNSDGVITHYNRACIAFAGRTPRIGEDRWCVTWKLYTEKGDFLPHDQCPMATAIRERRVVRGIKAVAERPDGSRVPFLPYPTPLLDDEGNLIGAVNLLLEVTGQNQAKSLRAQAERCRRLARLVADPKTLAVLEAMAAEYEEKALRLDQRN
jgi:PAS domain-containing protein